MSDLPLISVDVPIGRTKKGELVYPTKHWYDYWQLDQLVRMGGITAPSNSDLSNSVASLQASRAHSEIDALRSRIDDLEMLIRSLVSPKPRPADDTGALMRTPMPTRIDELQTYVFGKR